MSTRPARPLEWLQALPPPGKDLPAKRWVVLVRLALAMSKDGSGWVSIERLARESGAGVRTAQRAIEWARGAGRLERTSRGHRITDDRRAASTYQLLLPNRPANDLLADALPREPTGQTDDPTGQNGRPNRPANGRLRAPLQSPPFKDENTGAGRRDRTADAARPRRSPFAGIETEYIGPVAEELIAETDASSDEAGTITAMIDNGSHPQAVRNKIAYDRHGPRRERQRAAAAVCSRGKPIAADGSCCAECDRDEW